MRAGPVAVVCCHNRAADLPPLLDSLARQEGGGPAVIVVDNGSADGTADLVRERYPGAQLVASPVNLGGAGGFNLGMQAALDAGAGQVLLLDTDVTLAPDAVRLLAAALTADPAAAAVGPALLFADPADRVQELGADLLPAAGWLRPRWHRRRLAALPAGALAGPQPVDYLAACVLLVRARALREQGRFDDGYFLYWDDIDWCTRVRRAGWTVLAEPRARAWHRGGLYTRPTTAYYYYKQRNRLRYWRRWADPGAWPGALAAMEAELVRMAASCRRAGRAAIADTLADAVADAAAGTGGPAPAGRIRELAPRPPSMPALAAPVALLDWPAAEPELRYQTLWALAARLAGALPDGARGCLAAGAPTPELAQVAAEFGLVPLTAPRTVVIPCTHAGYARDYACSLFPGTEGVWGDAHGNLLPAGETPPPAAEPALAAAFAALRLAGPRP